MSDIEASESLCIGGVLASYLLDSYPARVAYSTRQLKTGATNALRVRRSSDNLELDIGFVSGGLDTTSLLTFTGAGNGFVTTWYDQSGNGYNATQGVQANQPQIVASGVLFTEGANPAIEFQGTRNLVNGALPMASLFPSSASVFRVIKINNDGAYTTLGSAGVDHWDCFAGTPPSSNGVGYVGVFCSTRLAGFPPNLPTNGHQLVTYLAGAQYHVYYNGASFGTSAYTYSSMPVGIYLGSTVVKDLTAGSTIQEVVFYDSDNISNRGAIETNINNYFGIF